MDIEDEVQKPLGKAALTDLTAYMLSTVESWGVYSMAYTGLWFGSTFLYMGGAELKPYDVWLAAYRTRKPAPGWPFGMWQYTSTARVPGVSTNVDLSHAYKDYAAIIRRAGLGAVKGAKKMNKVIFISQPMGGRSADEINAERRRVIEIARQKFGKVDVLETFFDDFGPAAKPLDYLARSIEFLAKADVAIFAPGWQNARGCRIEHQCAEDYGIPVMEV